VAKEFMRGSRVADWIADEWSVPEERAGEMNRASDKVARPSRPMPLVFDRHHPVGMIGNSPAFQRWERSQNELSPEGTAVNRCLDPPCGTYPEGHAHPALKRWAILVCPSRTDGVALMNPHPEANVDIRIM
jgi:hypothetical protein